MIIVKLFGGLGNQLFQYSLGMYLSKFNRVKVKFDVRALQADEGRDFELCYFVESIEIATLAEVNRIRSETSKLDLIKRKIHTAFNKKYKRKIIEDFRAEFSDEILRVQHSCYIEGYWQWAQIPESIQRVLFETISEYNDFDISAKNYLSTINTTNSISVHLRRGDFNDNHHIQDVLSLEYYKKSIELIKTCVVAPHFFIFSDDINWAEGALKLEGATFIKGTSAKEDFQLMRSAKHNIIANSSFSWWAAFLDKNTEKIVVAPKNWFNSTVNFSIQKIIPKTWRIID